ncbi:hypothetical protein NHX12_022605 [Muraenolepis orangiensis]|uniref:PR domain zinc finger protein 8 n=1 Tax=Muraenolepis orangiensis TaxID=630683 RepID=A0A9Q0IUH7_9TELE|nr:hypothetical protein NHX12_022605 [Muraenolepis orangiensis]
MDHTFSSRSFWGINDTKFPPDGPRAPDVYTGVVVTRPVPRGASFGPCLLQSTFYDTIAFIALKSCDKMTKSYLFRIDPEVMRNASLGVLSWLRLVRAARDGEEQNTEAYLRAGQLYVRSTRDIGPGEELLVWYDPELSRLLGFTEMTASKQPHEDLKCVKCHQVFEHEYPYLAHCRFLCALQAEGGAWSRHDTCSPKDAHKLMELKRQRRVTDFHNIARDLEHKNNTTTTTTDEDPETSSPDKRKCEESFYSKARKSVLLEKTNLANDHNITPSPRDYEHSSMDTPSFTLKLRADSLKAHHLDFKNNAFGEGRFTHEREPTPEVHPGGGGGGLGTPLRSAFSALSSRAQGERKSAFCKPNKTTYEESTSHPSMAQTAPSGRLNGVSGAFIPRTVAGYGTTPPTLMASSGLLVTGELAGGPAVPTHVSLRNAFHYAPQHWSRNMAPSLAVLPPTFTTFGVSVQNWCAKCNLSFRMTSDLVFHMRSHHKKEFAVESQVRKKREEKLTCPICHEYFRERHHLSRHMTSHN